VKRHRIACFISPHGFGHAARASSVMEAIYKSFGSVGFEIFTTVPEWFFEDSVAAPFSYHSLLTDIGLSQKTPLHVDIPGTVERLNRFFPFDSSHIERLAKQIAGSVCEMVICDIAPLGIAVAREAGVPSILVENFTWDWIYEGYVSFDARLKGHIDYLRGLFAGADHHIQVEPVCFRARADITTPPVSRAVRCDPRSVRERLKVPPNGKIVTVTMGGIPESYGFLKRLTGEQGIHFVIPGASRSVEIWENLALLPHHSEFYHPDLIYASDVVVGKVGYSTLAEVYHAGVPFGYIARPMFRESRVLTDYIIENMSGIAVEEEEFYSGSWVARLPDLFALPRIQRQGPNGAEQIARFICSLLRG